MCYAHTVRADQHGARQKHRHRASNTSVLPAMDSFIAMNNRLSITRRIASYRSGIRNGVGGFGRTLGFVIAQSARSGSRAATSILRAARAIILAFLYFAFYWAGRLAGSLFRLILWCGAALVKGFQDAW